LRGFDQKYRRHRHLAAQVTVKALESTLCTAAYHNFYQRDYYGTHPATRLGGSRALLSFPVVRLKFTNDPHDLLPVLRSFLPFYVQSLAQSQNQAWLRLPATRTSGPPPSSTARNITVNLSKRSLMKLRNITSHCLHSPWAGMTSPAVSTRHLLGRRDTRPVMVAGAAAPSSNGRKIRS